MNQTVSMDNKRQHTRYYSTAQAVIEGNRKEEAELKDISVTGCRIKAENYLEIRPHSKHEIRIIPEQESEVEAFKLSVEAKWAGTEVDSHIFGFGIIKSPEGKQFERYVDYLSWRYSQGNSMIGDSSPVIA